MTSDSSTTTTLIRTRSLQTSAIITPIFSVDEILNKCNIVVDNCGVADQVLTVDAFNANFKTTGISYDGDPDSFEIVSGRVICPNTVSALSCNQYTRTFTFSSTLPLSVRLPKVFAVTLATIFLHQ
jgi:hypothetical protein